MVLRTERTFIMRKCHGEHTCSRKNTNRQATAKWMAKEFMSAFRRKPYYKVKDMQTDLKEKYGIKVSNFICYKAKNRALTILRDNLEAHYGKLYSYRDELQRIDKEGTFELVFGEVCMNRRLFFKRFYIGYFYFIKGLYEWM